MDIVELNRAINRKHNLLLVEGRSLTDPEYQALLAEKERLLNPPPVIPDSPKPVKPRASKPAKKK